MQNTKKFLIFASLLFAACTSDPLQEPAGTAGDAGETAVSKICNTSAHAARGTLIAKFDDEAVPTLEQAAAQYAATRSGGAMTRSGIAPVDEILADLHVTSLERVFPRRRGARGAHPRGRTAQVVRPRIRRGAGPRRRRPPARRRGRNIEDPVQRQTPEGLRRQGLSVPRGAPRRDPRSGPVGLQRPEPLLAVALHQQRRPGGGHHRARRSRHQCGRRLETHRRRPPGHRGDRGRRG